VTEGELPITPNKAMADFTNLDFMDSEVAPAKTFNCLTDENVVDATLAATHPKVLARKEKEEAKTEAAEEVADTASSMPSGAAAGVDEAAEKDAAPADLPVVEIVVSLLHRRIHRTPAPPCAAASYSPPSMLSSPLARNAYVYAHTLRHTLFCS